MFSHEVQFNAYLIENLSTDQMRLIDCNPAVRDILDLCTEYMEIHYQKVKARRRRLNLQRENMVSLYDFIDVVDSNLGSLRAQLKAILQD